MKRLTLTLLLSLCAACLCGAAGKDDGLKELDKVLSVLPDHRVEADYSFKIMQGDVPVLFSGHATLQSGYFRISGNGLEIYCDGNNISYLDFEAKEVYVDSAQMLEDYIRANMNSIADLKVENVRTYEPSDDISIFTVPALDDSWVVTDLR